MNSSNKSEDCDGPWLAPPTSPTGGSSEGTSGGGDLLNSPVGSGTVGKGSPAEYARAELDC